MLIDQQQSIPVESMLGRKIEGKSNPFLLFESHRSPSLPWKALLLKDTGKDEERQRIFGRVYKSRRSIRLLMGSLKRMPFSPIHE